MKYITIYQKILNKTKKIIMKLYNSLREKMINNTITKEEKTLLFEIAFGKEYINSNDKGTLKEY